LNKYIIIDLLNYFCLLNNTFCSIVHNCGAKLHHMFTKLVDYCRSTRGGDLLRIDFHRTSYGVHKPLNDAVRHLNESAGLFDFHLAKNQLFLSSEVSVVISSDPSLYAG
jgi:hypothetical protein